MIRVNASVLLKFFVYFTKRTYFFYFTLSFLQNTQLSLSIINNYFNKIFILLLFFIILGLWQEDREKREVKQINKIIYTKLL